MGGASIGDLPSANERVLSHLIEQVAGMLRDNTEGGLPARTDILLRDNTKLRKWPWGTTGKITTRKSPDHWFTFWLLDSDGSETGERVCVSDKEKIGFFGEFGFVQQWDGLYGDAYCLTWARSLKSAVDAWTAKGTTVMSHNIT